MTPPRRENFRFRTEISRRTAGRDLGSRTRAQGIASSPEPAKPSFGILEYLLLLLLLGQPVLLEQSANQVDAAKLVYIAVFVAFYMVYTFPVLVQLDRWTRQPIIRWTLVLIGLFLFSGLVGHFQGIGISDYARDFSAVVDYTWILIIPYAFRSGKAIRPYYIALLCGVTLLAIAQANNFMVERGYTYGNFEALTIFNETGPASLFGVFMAAGLMNSSTGKKRLGYAVWMASMVLTALLSGTRTTIVATFVGFGFYMFLLARDRRSKGQLKHFLLMLLPFALGAALFLGGMLFGLIDTNAVLSRISDSSDTETVSIATRIVETENAWKAFQQSPVVGKGLGYKLANTSLAELDVTVSHDYYYVHDFPMWVLCKWGVLGAIIWIGFLLAMFRTTIRGFKRCKDAFEKGVFGSMAALLVAALVQSITANPFCVRASAGILSILMGLVVVLYRKHMAPLRPLQIVERTRLSAENGAPVLPEWLR